MIFKEFRDEPAAAAGSASPHWRKEEKEKEASGEFFLWCRDGHVWNGVEIVKHPRNILK